MKRIVLLLTCLSAMHQTKSIDYNYVGWTISFVVIGYVIVNSYKTSQRLRTLEQSLSESLVENVNIFNRLRSLEAKMKTKSERIGL